MLYWNKYQKLKLKTMFIFHIPQKVLNTETGLLFIQEYFLPPLDPLCVLVMVVLSSCVCYLGHRCASTTPTASPCHRHLVSLHPSLLGDRATTPNYLRICRNNLEWPLQWLNTIICVIYSVHVFINNDLSILNLNSTQWKITLSNWQRLLTFAYLSRIVK